MKLVSFIGGEGRRKRSNLVPKLGRTFRLDNPKLRILMYGIDCAHLKRSYLDYGTQICARLKIWLNFYNQRINKLTFRYFVLLSCIKVKLAHLNESYLDIGALISVGCKINLIKFLELGDSEKLYSETFFFDKMKLIPFWTVIGTRWKIWLKFWS